MPPLSFRLPDSQDGPSQFVVVPAEVSDEGSRPPRVVFPNHRGEWTEALLDASGRWDCPRLPVLNRVLNALYPPQGGAVGRCEALQRVARWLKGRVEG